MLGFSGYHVSETFSWDVGSTLTSTVVLFPTYDAPKYKYGYQILILFGGLAILGTLLLGYLHKRDAEKQSSEENETSAGDT